MPSQLLPTSGRSTTNSVLYESSTGQQSITINHGSITGRNTAMPFCVKCQITRQVSLHRINSENTVILFYRREACFVMHPDDPGTRQDTLGVYNDFFVFLPTIYQYEYPIHPNEISFNEERTSDVEIHYTHQISDHDTYLINMNRIRHGPSPEPPPTFCCNLHNEKTLFGFHNRNVPQYTTSGGMYQYHIYTALHQRSRECHTCDESGD
ncbi:uncharacterized protein LOC134220141 [Armigeres subalbatus]|uniref:uncharacterized protein LOC134220141 n=1 Tax=Armigeres subalbatus TaxID=124917 RepID=UPI002ED6326E